MKLFAGVTFKDCVQISITVAVVATYCYLTIVGKASIEGFVAIATYVIKKFLDIIEENNGGSTK